MPGGSAMDRKPGFEFFIEFSKHLKAVMDEARAPKVVYDEPPFVPVVGGWSVREREDWVEDFRRASPWPHY
jgi:hypothetical protein